MQSGRKVLLGPATLELEVGRLSDLRVILLWLQSGLRLAVPWLPIA